MKRKIDNLTDHIRRVDVAMDALLRLYYDQCGNDAQTALDMLNEDIDAIKDIISQIVDD